MPVSSAIPPLAVDDRPPFDDDMRLRLDRLAQLVSELGEVPMDVAHRAVGLSAETTDGDPLTVVAAALVLLRDRRRSTEAGLRPNRCSLVF